MLLTSVRVWTSMDRRRSLSRAFRRLATKPGAAQPSPRSTPNPVSGSLANTGTTTTVGSVAISL